jgi:nitrilase
LAAAVAQLCECRALDQGQSQTTNGVLPSECESASIVRFSLFLMRGKVMTMTEPIRVAVIQDCPVPFDLAGSVAKAERLVAKAAETGAKLVVFPEAFVSGYPKGLDFGARVGMRSLAGRETFRRYYDSALDLSSADCRRLGATARAARVHLVIGVIEKDGGTLYCTVLFFGPDGAV